MCVVPRQRLAPRLNLTVLTTALVVTALDEVTKAWARSALRAHPRHVWGPLWLSLQYNSGVSFSFDPSGALVTTVVTLVVALVVLVVALQARPGVASLGFGLLIGGGVANVVDRLTATPHEVTDFVAVGRFPVFNLADASLSIGFVILVVAAARGVRLLGS